MKKYSLFIILALLTISFYHNPAFAKKAIPTGSYQYSVTANGTKIGTAIYTCRLINSQYQSSTEITLRVGDAVTSMKEITVETLQFKPVKYVSITSIMKGDFAHRSELSADFADRTVLLKDGDDKKEIVLQDDFYISTNFILNQMLNQAMNADTEISINIYDPSTEEEKILQITEKIVGKEKVDINGKEKDLFHIVQSYADVKDVHSFIDSSGVTYKTTASILNTDLELVLIKKTNE